MIFLTPTIADCFFMVYGEDIQEHYKFVHKSRNYVVELNSSNLKLAVLEHKSCSLVNHTTKVSQEFLPKSKILNET